MNAMLKHNQIRYQRQLLQDAIHELNIARQQFMNYRSQISGGYDAQEMHYVIITINEVLQQISNMQQDAQYLLEQFSFVQRSYI